MTPNPTIKSRKPNRLKGYGYSKEGYYFVTICVQNRLCLFGDIIGGKMVLNSAGEMIKKWWLKLPEKFENICFEDVFVVMPNHIHGIIIIENNKPIRTNPCVNVGTDPRVCPEDKNINSTDPSVNVGTDPRVCPEDKNINSAEDKHAGLSLQGLSLSEMMQWFKTMTTNEYIKGVKNQNWQGFDKKLWQRSFYDHVIRDEKALFNIQNYIIENPLKWENDDYNLNKI